MKTLRRILIVGVLVALASLTVQAQTATPGAPTLLALLSPSNCSRTCFMGIQPGITTLAELKNILMSRGFTYNINSLGDETNANYEWRMPLTGLGFAQGTQSTTFINTAVSNGIVRQMFVGLDIPIQTIIAAYGQPPQYLTANSDAVYMVYPQHKMIFQPIGAYSTEIVTGVILFDDSAFDDFVSGMIPVTNCTQATGICAVQTATPPPGSTEPIGAASTISTGTPLPTLRETFNASSCVVSCWEGIKPGVTTRTQLETLLVQRGINPIIHPISNREIVYIWTPINSPYINTRGDIYRAGITVFDGIVIDINLPVDILLQQIIKEYGAPTIAYEAISNDGRYSLWASDLDLKQYSRSILVQPSKGKQVRG